MVRRGDSWPYAGAGARVSVGSSVRAVQRGFTTVSSLGHHMLPYVVKRIAIPLEPYRDSGESWRLWDGHCLRVSLGSSKKLARYPLNMPSSRLLILLPGHRFAPIFGSVRMLTRTIADETLSKLVMGPLVTETGHLR